MNSSGDFFKIAKSSFASSLPSAVRTASIAFVNSSGEDSIAFFVFSCASIFSIFSSSHISVFTFFAVFKVSATDISFQDCLATSTTFLTAFALSATAAIFAGLSETSFISFPASFVDKAPRKSTRIFSYSGLSTPFHLYFSSTVRRASICFLSVSIS